MAQASMRTRPEKPGMSYAPQARQTDLDPALELHTGQRRVNSRTDRPDTRKHLDYMHHSVQDSSCIRRGVHTRTLTGHRGQKPPCGSGSDRLQQFRIIVPRRVHPLADGPGSKGTFRRWMQQRSRISICLPEPRWPVRRFEDHRHSIVQLCYVWAGSRSDDGEGPGDCAVRPLEPFPQASEGHRSPYCLAQRC